MRRMLFVAASLAALVALTGCMGRGLMGGGLASRDYPVVTTSPVLTAADLARHEQIRAECIQVVEATSPGAFNAGIGGAILGGVSGAAGGALGAVGYNAASGGANLGVGPYAVLYGGVVAVTGAVQAADYEMQVEDYNVRSCIEARAAGLYWHAPGVIERSAAPGVSGDYRAMDSAGQPVPGS